MKHVTRYDTSGQPARDGRFVLFADFLAMRKRLRGELRGHWNRLKTAAAARHRSHDLDPR